MKNQWVKLDNGDWNYYNSDGNKVIDKWLEIDDLWYCFDVNGKMRTGWFKDKDNRWYYMYEISDSKNNQVKGSMAIGWLKNNNSWYMLCNKSDSSKGIYRGQMLTGWYQDTDNKWYYLIEESCPAKAEYLGQMVSNCTRAIGSKSYSFDEHGVWIEDNSLISDSLVDFIAGWESFYSKAYEDPYYKGVQSYWTIGYGTCYCAIPEAFPYGLSSTCTESQAKSWLKQEANKVAKVIKSALGNTVLSQQAFDCLVDIGYNAGTGSLIGGNTWNSIISGDSTRITNALMSWNKANGVVSAGLTKRCKSRVNMCLYGVYDSTH